MLNIALPYSYARRIRVVIPLFLADMRIGLTVNDILDLLVDGHDNPKKQQIILQINVK